MIRFAPAARRCRALVILVGLVLCSSAGSVAAQGRLPPAPTTKILHKNYVHAELFGNGGLYSLNYTRRLLAPLSIRLGISYFAIGAALGDSGARARLLTTPLLANYLVGRGAHKLELGLGVVLVHASAGLRLAGRELLEGDRLTFLGTGAFGYRYLRDGGFTFNATLTPLFGPFFLPWGGMGIGYSF